MPDSRTLKIVLTLLSWMVPMTGQSVTPSDLAGQEPLAVAFYEHAALQAERAASGRPYLPFLTVPTMRAGLYELAAGAEDGQQPHGRDELYYVVEGRSRFTAGSETTDVGPGSVLFVAADVEHRFHDITESLSIVVFFSEVEPEQAELEQTEPGQAEQTEPEQAEPESAEARPETTGSDRDPGDA